MRAIIQRVEKASVEAGGKEISSINRGLLVLVGITGTDGDKEIRYIADKCLNLRLFDHGAKNFDFSVLDLKGEILIVSQFTLYGECNKGRRPDFGKAMVAEQAEVLYRRLVEEIRKSGLSVKEGQFRTTMKVKLINDGPVTIILDSNSPLI